jgi:Skp family chaperone for outer membrane proteins
MTKIFTKSALLSAAMATSLIISGAAIAQDKDKKKDKKGETTQVVPVSAPTPAKGGKSAGAQGIATANQEVAMLRTNAYRVAMEQMAVTYKAQIDARDGRARTLNAELQAMGLKIEEDSKKPANQANPKLLEPAVKAFQSKQQAAQAEVQQLSGQIDLALAYVEEQLSLKESEAIRAAMRKNKIDMLIAPNVIIARENTVDITAALTDEYNVLVPQVQIVPPAGYRPGALIAQAEQAARAAAGAQTPAAPTAPVVGTPPPAAQPDGR